MLHGMDAATNNTLLVGIVQMQTIINSQTTNQLQKLNSLSIKLRGWNTRNKNPKKMWVVVYVCESESEIEWENERVINLRINFKSWNSLYEKCFWLNWLNFDIKLMKWMFEIC